MREELKNWLLAEDAEDQHKGQAPIEFFIFIQLVKIFQINIANFPRRE